MSTSDIKRQALEATLGRSGPIGDLEQEFWGRYADGGIPTLDGVGVGELPVKHTDGNLIGSDLEMFSLEGASNLRIKRPDGVDPSIVQTEETLSHAGSTVAMRLVWAQTVASQVNAYVGFTGTEHPYENNPSEIGLDISHDGGYYQNNTGKDITLILSYQLVFDAIGGGYRQSWISMDGSSYNRIGLDSQVADSELGNYLKGTACVNLSAGRGFQVKVWHNAGQTIYLNPPQDLSGMHQGRSTFLFIMRVK